MVSWGSMICNLLLFNPGIALPISSSPAEQSAHTDRWGFSRFDMQLTKKVIIYFDKCFISICTLFRYPLYFLDSAYRNNVLQKFHFQKVLLPFKSKRNLREISRKNVYLYSRSTSFEVCRFRVYPVYLKCVSNFFFVPKPFFEICFQTIASRRQSCLHRTRQTTHKRSTWRCGWDDWKTVSKCTEWSKYPRNASYHRGPLSSRFYCNVGSFQNGIFKKN